MVAPLPLADDELSAWLRLSVAPALKPAALRAMLAAFGLPQQVLAQPFAALAAVAGTEAARAALAPVAPDFAAQLDAVREWRALPGNAVLTLGDPAYPPRLLTMPDPPPLLYIRGRVDRLHARSVAIVGSRSATPQGVEDAERFARALSGAGIVVVSGLALGVDGAAHRGAIGGVIRGAVGGMVAGATGDATAGPIGGTVAVIGTGADRIYPASHHALAEQIAVHGAILSEWPLGTPARSSNFPQRNRLIAGLVEGVLVVEAAMRSGSLITARLANDMGRDVFALPGSIHAPLSRGCHRLIKQGARLVETPEEILEELGIAAAAPPAERRKRRPAIEAPRGMAIKAAPTPTNSPAAMDAAASLLLDALGYAPASLEILAERTDMPEATLQATLLQLELAGRVCALPGGRFVRAVHC
ncbi:MAG TPA: DNA-processing protein DprA [Paraburkholderia sp.]|jgi:DNA processing protein|nr:DNA-processing protein DprA [Paraburkholderia sp.]